MKFLKLKLLILCFIYICVESYVYASDEIIMGVFPRRNSTATIKMFSPLANYLSVELGKKVKIRTAKNFPTFWKNVQEKKYDIVHYNQLHYILSHKKAGYEVIAKNEEYGVSELKPAIVVRKDSGINSVKDLKGKSIAFGGGKLGMISYVGNKRILQEAGLTESDYKSSIAKNPPNATMAVYFNKSDAAGVGDIALSLPMLKKKIDTEQLKLLAVGSTQPHIPWVVKTSMNSQDKTRVQSALLKLNDTDVGKKILKNAGLTGVLKAKDSDYDISRKTYNDFKTWKSN